MPDYALKETVKTAIEDPNCELTAAKRLLRQMQEKVDDLSTRLSDYEDTTANINPANLP